jgi:hypothetical protein
MAIELHGSPMLQGRGHWRTLPVADRVLAIQDALRLLAAGGSTDRLFAVVLKKSIVLREDPVKLAFEYLTNRFDRYLMRLLRVSLLRAV